MLMKLLGQTDTETDSIDQKRRYERRECDQCVAEIGGKTYPVMNWSQGGALIFTDERLFAENDNVNILMKFHIQDQILAVSSDARIIRKNNNRIAVAFTEDAPESKQQFQQIIADITTREFADSQV